jgi:hypothetical protein
MLRAALYTGLVSIRTGLEGITSHAVLAECDTLLDDVRDQTKDEARAAQVALITDWGYEVLAVLDEPPF